MPGAAQAGAVKAAAPSEGKGQRGAAAPTAATPSAAPAAPAVHKVKLSDLAAITTISTQNEITRFDGKESFVVEVVKNQDANTADVASNVKDILASFGGQIQLRYPRH